MATRRANNPRNRDADYFTNLVYTKSGRPRFTQDSPILLDVFVHYGTQSDKTLDLLLTPDWSKSPGEVADELRLRLDEVRSTDTPANKAEKNRQNARQIAHNQSVVAVKLSFEELVCNVLPLSWWWQKALIAAKNMTPLSVCADPKLKQVVRDELIDGLERILGEEKGVRTSKAETSHWLIQEDFIWAARLFWIVQHANRDHGKKEPAEDTEKIADYFLDDLIPNVARRQEELSARKEEAGKLQRPLTPEEQLFKDWNPPRDPWVYSINRNREIDSSVNHSIETTKADAAVRTFDVRGWGLKWAIIDSGIDARHIAFRERNTQGEPHAEPFGDDGRNHTRIVASYDFSGIRKHLSSDQQRALKGKAGRLVDWEDLEARLKDKLRIPHSSQGYRTPKSSHGTHVAGILAADWTADADASDPLGPPPMKTTPRKPLRGLCPEIELYDLRVFDDDGRGDEFAVMSALQFVRSLNQRHDALEVHGVNLSLAMQHEVTNYACGRSPVCEECTRLVGNGVVVVTAAGNQGRSIHTTTQGRAQEGYRSVSIADPGNAEAVITVGATHRKEPHTFGVSYFSSRGPTGDGRAKPDLVAPGEKIVSTVPGDRMERQDGTSQAAPHVSGAAALLMSRHTEMIGQPAQIKKVLMETATDLGREPHFQGAGLVDVMRAIQRL